MGGPYYIPRDDLKGEGRIFFIFSTKALIYTVIGGIIGLIFFSVFSAINLSIVGIVILAILAVIGFVIGTFKIPDTQGLELTRKAGGEKIDDIIVRYIRFKMRKNKIYLISEEEEENEWS